MKSKIASDNKIGKNDNVDTGNNKNNKIKTVNKIKELNINSVNKLIEKYTFRFPIYYEKKDRCLFTITYIKDKIMVEFDKLFFDEENGVVLKDYYEVLLTIFSEDKNQYQSAVQKIRKIIDEDYDLINDIYDYFYTD